MAIHHSAAQGFARDANTYVRGRPEYPDAVDDWLRDALGLGPGTEALDVGAGTGKFTRRLQGVGAKVEAVEPVEAMRAAFVQAVPGVPVHPGSAEALPFDTGRFDAVVCAQAFHWFPTRAAVAEFRRVLKPGGILGLIWNVRDESVDWVAHLTKILRPFEGDTPRYASGAWRKAFPASGFGPLTESRIPHGHTGPAEQVIVARVLSVSFIAALPEAQRTEVAEAVRAMIARYPALRGKETVTFPYYTACYSCVRTDA
jgi:SAM-dependent methyltransferase